MNDMAPRLGHNRAAVDPDAYAEFQARVRDFADAAGAWLDLRAISDEDQAARLKDFIDGSRGLWKAIDDGRKRDKEPHLTAGKAVDDAYKALLAPIEKAIERTKALQTDWLRREKARLDAERAEAQRIATEEAEKAAAILRAARERNDVMGEAEAEEQAARAREAGVAAAREARARVTSATGGGRATGLRTRRRGEITNWNVAFRAVSDRHRVREAIQAEIDAIVRSAAYGANPVAIPGVEVVEETFS